MEQQRMIMTVQVSECAFSKPHVCPVYMFARMFIFTKYNQLQKNV